MTAMPGLCHFCILMFVRRSVTSCGLMCVLLLAGVHVLQGVNDARACFVLFAGTVRTIVHVP